MLAPLGEFARVLKPGGRLVFSTHHPAAIRDMVVRGAPAIGCAAAFGVVLSKGSADGYEVLSKSRPTAVNLFWALARMKKAKDLKAEDEAAAFVGAGTVMATTARFVGVPFSRSCAPVTPPVAVPARDK